jgi:hypothetical protein
VPRDTVPRILFDEKEFVMPSPYKFLNKPQKMVKAVMVCNEDEYGGYIDLFFDENWQEIGWQPTYPELADQTSCHYTQTVINATQKEVAHLKSRPIIVEPRVRLLAIA